MAKKDPQLFVRRYGSSEWTLLDLYDAEPIKLNLRVQDVTEPTVSVSSYSQSFRVPNTSANGIFFEQVFNVNQTFFDPTKKAQAYILDNGETYIDGNVTLLNVYVNSAKGGIEYEISFMAETSDFASQIGIENKGFLTDLDFSQYNHDLNYYNITSSWTGNLFEGDVLYPLVEWGYTYSGSGNQTLPSIPTLSIQGTNSFTNSANPLKIEQLKPAMRVKAIWDAIFATTDYTYESAFLGTNTTGPAGQPASAKDFFMNLYTVSDSQARAELTNTIGWKGHGFNVCTFNVGQNPGLSGLGTLMKFETESFDYGNNFNLDFDEFTISIIGQYEFRLKATYSSFFGGQIYGDPILIWTIVDVENNTPIQSAYYNLPNSYDTLSLDLPYYFDQSYAGKRIQFYIKLVGATVQNPDPWNPQTYNTGVCLSNYSVETIQVPTKVNPAAALPSQIKQIDFIRSIVERFKLVFEPSKTKPKHFIITPWNDWIVGGTVVDWTTKLNAVKDYKITPLFKTQERFVTYRDQEDSDYINYNYQQAYKQTFGQRNLDSQIEVIKGTKEVQGIFAPMPIGPIGYGTGATAGQINRAETFLIPHLAKDEVTNDGPGKRTPMQPKVRLGYYNPVLGMVDSSATWYLDNSGVAEAQTKHPLISSYYPTPYGGNTAPKTLDWRSVQASTDPKINTLPFLPDLQGPGSIKNPSGIISADNFNLYWERWYKATYGEFKTITLSDGSSKQVNDFSVLFEGEFILNYDDVKNLRFNDIVFVKDAYYLINEIKDYEIGKQTECKVQLFKINNLGLPLPNTYQPLEDVCFSNVSLCDAECCDVQSALTTLYTSTPDDLEVGTPLYVDPRATTLAAPGWYNYNFNIYQVGVNGTITTITPVGTSSCVCVPTLFPKTLCFYPASGGEACLACCCQDTNVEVWLADNTATWYTNTNFYSDYAGYGNAADGWYSDENYFVQVVNGQAQQSGPCDCNCLIYDIHPIVLCYGATKCDAVCCTASIAPQYWTTWDGTGSAIGFILYSNQTGTLATAGYYYSGDLVLQVNASGEIIATPNPADCFPCVNETLNVYFDFYSAVNGTGAFQIEKSYDSIFWLPLYNKDISTINAQTNFTSQSAIAPTTYVRGKLIYGQQHDTGVFATRIVQTNALLNTQNTVKYTNYSFTPPQFSLANQEYKFIVNLTGSSLLCGITGAQALTCTDPDCIIDGYNSIYNVNSDLEVCCDPLTVTDAGFGSVNNATYFIDSTCATPPPATPCYGCLDNINGTYALNDYHVSEPYYICNDLVATSLTLYYTANDRPNRFNVYNLSGSLVSTSGWRGYADYAGPWGMSLNTPDSGILGIGYEQGLYITVETGPASPFDPISDSWNIQIACN